MAGLADVMQLVNNLPALMSLFERAFFITICLFLGNFAWRGWKRYKNWGVTMAASLGLGFAVLAGAVLLAGVIPVTLPYVPYAIQALIMAVIFYIILRLFSGDAERVGRLVKGATFKKLKKEFEELREQFHRLVKLLEYKKITPQPLSAKELEKELNKVLADKDYKEFTITTKRTINDNKVFNLKIKDNTYSASLDIYTGELTAFNKTSLKTYEQFSRTLKRLAANKKLLAGTIITAVTVALMLLLSTPEAVNKINQMLDLSLTPATTNAVLNNYEIKNETCLSVTDALYLISTKSYDDFEGGVSAPEAVMSAYPNDYFGDTARITYEGSDYLVITSRTITDNEYERALQNYMQENIFNVVQGNIDFCEINYQEKSISNYIRICTMRESICECKLLSEVSDYCFVFSDKLSNELSSQLQGLKNMLK